MSKRGQVDVMKNLRGAFFKVLRCAAITLDDITPSLVFHNVKSSSSHAVARGA